MTATISPALDTSTVGAIQRRIVLVLAAAQVLGGVGVATGAAVGALLAADMASDSFSGLASAASVTGAALIAIPVSRVMDAHGRRPGLMLAYAIGICGALTTVIGATRGLVSACPARPGRDRRRHDRHAPVPLRRDRPGESRAPRPRPVDCGLGNDIRLSPRPESRLADGPVRRDDRRTLARRAVSAHHVRVVHLCL